MTKARKLKICNWSLLVSAILILVSSIQLEATGSRGEISVWIHIILALVFTFLAGWHIWLHFGWSDWFVRFHKIRKPVTRILWYLLLLTVILGVAATIMWIGSQTHSPLGGVHGKVGFLMILVAIGHTVKRIKFFRAK